MKLNFIIFAVISSLCINVANAKTLIIKKHPAIASKNACSALGDNYINIPGTSSCIKLYGEISASVVAGTALTPNYLTQTDLSSKTITGIVSRNKLGIETISPFGLGNLHVRL